MLIQSGSDDYENGFASVNLSGSDDRNVHFIIMIILK